MNEFLTTLSSGQPVLWALFVLGVMAASALLLTAFWGSVFRLSGLFRRKRAPISEDDVLP